MGVIDRVRSWLGLDGGKDDEPSEDTKLNEGGNDGDNAGLNPDGAIETRGTSTDDAVDALSDL